MSLANLSSPADIQDFLTAHEEKELVRLLTCGNVDDGKSTLIGRLLLDAGLLASDVLASLEADSKTYGTTGGGIDPALLLDGLQAEREQGITIDVAHRYFFTKKRKFILADVPGHTQYTRNMATAASSADMALVLVDATKGITEQTRRHSTIISLCGVRHVIVAVNKMDAVSYDERVFERIRSEFTEFATRLDCTDLHFIPLSALTGGNVVHASETMSWYQGATLLYLLENVHIASDRNLIDFRFPVQLVSRPDASYRGYAGTVSSGTVRPGDEVIIFPSRKHSRIRRIDTYEGALPEAFAGQAITLTLTDELDISRGDVLAHPNNVPTFEDHLEAIIISFGEEPLEPKTEYVVRLGRMETKGVIEFIRYELDVNTHHRRQAQSLPLNAIGRVGLHLHQKVPCDSYKRNRTMGSFILIDRVTNHTVGAGMILDRKLEDGTHWEKEPTSRTLQKEKGEITVEERVENWHQKPVTLLFSGFSGSGKSTIAHALEQRLFSGGNIAMVLDGENMRMGLNRDLGFTSLDRSENVRRTMEVAKLLNDSGIIALSALIAPTEEIRANARALIGSDRFLLIHCDAPLEECKKRHAKGLYEAESQKGGMDVPGVSSAYEKPMDADLTLDTAGESVEENVEKLVQLLKEHGIILFS